MHTNCTLAAEHRGVSKFVFIFWSTYGTLMANLKMKRWNVCCVSTIYDRNSYCRNTSTPVTVMVKSKNNIKVSVLTCYCLLNTDEDKNGKAVCGKSNPPHNPTSCRGLSLCDSHIVVEKFKISWEMAEKHITILVSYQSIKNYWFVFVLNTWNPTKPAIWPFLF